MSSETQRSREIGPDDTNFDLSSEPQNEKSPGEDRLIVLCDGVFAIALTLLALDIKVPEGLSEIAFNAALRETLLSRTIFYVVTFAILSGYWLQHRTLTRVLLRSDGRYIQLTFLFLIFVAFFPVTSSLIAEGYDYPLAVILYTLGFAGCGFSSLLLWLYASWHHRLISQSMTREEIKDRAIHIILTPAYFTASLLLLLTPLPPSSVFWSWLLLPVFTRVILFFLPNKQRAHRV